MAATIKSFSSYLTKNVNTIYLFLTVLSSSRIRFQAMQNLLRKVSKQFTSAQKYLLCLLFK